MLEDIFQMKWILMDMGAIEVSAVDAFLHLRSAVAPVHLILRGNAWPGIPNRTPEYKQ